TQPGHVPPLGSERRPDVGSHQQSELCQVFDGTIYWRSIPSLEFLVQRSGTQPAGNLPEGAVSGRRRAHSRASRARSAVCSLSIAPHTMTELVLDLLQSPDNNPRQSRQAQAFQVAWGVVCSSNNGSSFSLMRNRRQP